MYLEKIKQTNDIKKIEKEHLDELAQEIRDFLIEKISVTGGHLGSNLGCVELTMALHLALDLPKDKIVWDVGHQAYTHKLLTGRVEGFDTLRKYGGMSGFPKRKESNCDCFDTGHSSTSISAGLGLVQARDLRQEDFTVVSVIGDGALTGGMAYEALNNAAKLEKNFIVILNDNNMSISENVGGMSKYLNGIRSDAGYNELKKHVSSALSEIPVIGEGLVEKISRTKNSIKQLFIPGMLFENMGITYLGPVDGHDVKAMVKIFREARKMDHAVLVHVLTKKGKGYGPAEKNPARFHGVEPFDIDTGKPLKEKIYPSYTDVFSKELCRIARDNPRVAAITAAMPDGTGLKAFGHYFPDRFFDVGIAEQHAVTSAAGMAAAGLKRLGLENRISRYFTPEEMLPAAGQGILAVQGRQDLDYGWLSGCFDREAACCALAERAFVRALGGGCSSPVAAYAVPEGTQLWLRGFYSEPDGTGCWFGELRGSAEEPEKLGLEMARKWKEETHGR